MIKFLPHPEIALTKAEYDPARHRAMYKVNYAELFKRIYLDKTLPVSALREIVKQDLFFVVCFVMGIELANHPFVVNACQTVEEGPKTKTLDVWARGHFKSVTITTAETIQRILTNPEETHVIFSYKKPKAEDFLGAIKRTLEKPFLVSLFPEILYENPNDSPSWSLQNGIVVKRQSVSRKEKTVEAYGVIEGMPTGGHWDRRIYDDIETADLAKNPEQLQHLINMFELSKNLGTPNGTERVIGTYYSHCGLLVHLRDKKTIHGEPAYHTRIIPATEDGKASGKPVFLTQEQLDDLKPDRTFNSQQLCNPTPMEEIKLNYSYLNFIEPKMVPKDVIKLMMVDQAGDKAVQTSGKDSWGFGVIGVKPNFDDICASDVYILDLECGQMEHSEAINGIVQMYIRNGMILQLGVEKVALSTTEIHIANALKARGRHLSRENGNLVDLKPAGRSTEKRVEGALQWPLNNGKLFVSKLIPAPYVDKIKEEMDFFPFYHSDALNMLAYGYDMMKDNPYLRYYMGDEDEDDENNDTNVIPIGRKSVGGYG